eukprot:588669-Rhodomonas_salina.1
MPIVVRVRDGGGLARRKTKVPKSARGAGGRCWRTEYLCLCRGYARHLSLSVLFLNNDALAQNDTDGGWCLAAGRCPLTHHERCRPFPQVPRHQMLHAT